MYIVAIDPAHKSGFQERAGLGLGSMEGVHESSVFWKIKKKTGKGRGVFDEYTGCRMLSLLPFSPFVRLKQSQPPEFVASDQRNFKVQR